MAYHLLSDQEIETVLRAAIRVALNDAKTAVANAVADDFTTSLDLKKSSEQAMLHCYLVAAIDAIAHRHLTVKVAGGRGVPKG